MVNFEKGEIKKFFPKLMKDPNNKELKIEAIVIDLEVFVDNGPQITELHRCKQISPRNSVVFNSPDEGDLSLPFSAIDDFKAVTKNIDGDLYDMLKIKITVLATNVDSLDELFKYFNRYVKTTIKDAVENTYS